MKDLLPKSLEAKILSVVGYLEVIFSLYISYLFMSKVLSDCAATLPDIRFTNIVFGLANLGIAVSIFFAIWGLRKREHLKHVLMTYVVIAAVAVLQLFITIGLGFAIGTACTT